jgi:choice-of-anchor A domain-containing protein
VFTQFRKLALPLAAVAAVAIASPAAADANVGLQVLREYNLYVLSDLNSTSSVEGRTFVGGNLSGGSDYYKYNGGKTPPPSATNAPGLTVVGSSSGSKNLHNGSGALVGGSVSGGWNLNGSAPQNITIGGSASGINGSKGSSITVGGAASGVNGNGATVKTNQGLPGFAAGLQVQASDYAMGVKDLSAYLAGLTPTDAVTFPQSNLMKFEPKSTGKIAVFSFDNADVFKTAGQLQFLTGGFDTIIVNVGGTSATLAKNFINSSADLGQHVIWNFYELAYNPASPAQNLNFKTAFYGSILAPGAYATNNNHLEGSAVFGKLDQRGQVHLNGFNGGLTIGSAVPEPATWAMMIIGFGLLGSAIRRKRRVALAA